MSAAAEHEDFEEAARLRDLIVEVESVSHRRTLASEQTEDVDIYGVHVADGNAAVVILVLRNGQVLDRRELFWEGAGEVSVERLLSELLPQVYDLTTFIPREIHLPTAIEGEEGLLDWLSGRRGGRVYLRLPSRGTKAKRVALAMQNAKLAHRRRFRQGNEGAHAGAVALARHLGLPEAPQRIEGFDVSNLQGSETVASLVVWSEGRTKKSDYRSFNIRTVVGQDDFAAMREAVERRYRRQLEEAAELPDLILIDGGRGQLNAALEGLAMLGIEETPIVGLAKREEEIYLPSAPEPLRLARTDAGLQLLQVIRDEAHRFAVGRHRRRRSARSLRSGFDDLRGIGEQRRKRLVRHFGSFRGVREASEEQLAEILGPRLAQSVHRQLHAEASSVPDSLPDPASHPAD
jgi:excinuclease ABC subunit C